MRKTQTLLTLLTLSRIPFALGIFYFLIQRDLLPALFLFLIGVLTDWLDGAFARKYHLETDRGEKLLEPLADSLLIFIPLVGLTAIGFLSLKYFLFFCLIGLLSQIAKHSYKKYYSKIHFFQIVYLFGAEIYLALWLANQLSRGWVLTVLVFYAIGGYLKRMRVRSFFTYLE